MYKHLLVPIDGSAATLGLIDQAVDYAAATHARLTFFHASEDLGATGSGAMLHATDPQALAAATQAPGRALLAKAEAAARQRGLEGDSLLVVSDRVPEAILDAAQRLGCDLVYLASRRRRGLAAAWSGSVTRQLIEAGRCPVLVTCVDAGVRHSAKFRALGCIRDEHHSLAAVLHGLEHLARCWADTRQTPDFRLLGAMLYYIEHFPERLHHPKEESQIFARLSRHTDRFDRLIAELSGQHRSGSQALSALRSALQAFERGDAGAGDRFFDLALIFVRSQWRHMAAEEHWIFPAASAHLTPDDWEAVAAAFEGHADLQFSHAADAPFEQLFARIAHFASGAMTTPAPTATSFPPPGDSP